MDAQVQPGKSKLPSPPIPILISAIAASIYAWLVFFTTFSHPGVIGIDYNAAGSDWIAYHGAARSYFEGHLVTIFDGDRFTAFLNQRYDFWLSAKLPFRPWVYPPSYLLLILPFGTMDLVASYAAFQFVTAGALVAALVIGAERDKRSAQIIAACALLCPAAAVNAVNGQNAFLAAALLVAGIRLLNHRPLLAGLVLGIVSVKPQFALLLPIALVAARQWRALFGVFVSAFALVVVSAMVFGWDAWIIWLQQTAGNLISPDPKWVEYGRMWGNSVWTCAVLIGATPGIASVLQLASMVLAVAAVGATFHRTSNDYSRLAVLLPATLLAAPHWSPYDGLLLALGGLFWLTQRLEGEGATRPWILMLALWFIPIYSPPIRIPVSGLFLPLLIVGFIGVAIRLGRKDLETGEGNRQAPQLS